VELTRCRDLKEQHCAVSPTPLSREEGPVHHAPPVQVSHGGIRFELGLERFLVPEVLFQGRRSLPWLVHEAGRRAVAMVPPKERPATWARLLGSVVVVGGTAMLPGLRSRLQSELQERVDSTEFLMTEGLEDPPKVHVLEPLPKSGGPRVAVFYGLQLAAVAACAGGIVRTEDLASPKGFAPHDNPGRPNADCLLSGLVEKNNQRSSSFQRATAHFRHDCSCCYGGIDQFCGGHCVFNIPTSLAHGDRQFLTAPRCVYISLDGAKA